MKPLFTLFRAVWLVLLLLAGVLTTACNDDDEDDLNDTITPVANVFAPADNLFVRLDPPSNAVVTFEWEPARVADGTVVLYEVLFDKESGDFSKPIYSAVSGTSGLEPKLVLSHGDLNRVANLAGIASLNRGKLKWTVNATKGLNVQRSSISRVLEVQRPAGFASVPANLYLTGSGTEAGTAAAQALPFKQVGAGVYEIYTQLKAGDVKFISATTGAATTYYIDGANLREGTTGGTSPTTTPKVYRLRLDFNNAAATVTEIVQVGLWIAAENKVTVTLPYTNNGQWKLARTPIEFFQFSWGRDERYKFQFVEKDAAGATTNVFYGSTNADNQRATAATPAAYYHLVPGPDNQWDYTFKFRTEVDKANVDITVKMQATGPYTHVIEL